MNQLSTMFHNESTPAAPKQPNRRMPIKPISFLFFPLFFLSLFLASPAALEAQNRLELSGTLENAEGEPLEWASIILFHPEDSTMLAFGYSDQDGKFRIPQLQSQNYLLRIGFVGMQDYQREIALNESMDLGLITLEAADAISGVEVTATRIPILVQRDTVIYDAQAFNLAQNATVEDLLRRLPGVEVDADGNIRALGEDVQNVLVNGRRFFGGDSRIATRNLQADAVNRVQIYDKKSEEAEFTGIDDGSRERTINLELKEDRRGGGFGYVSGAYGPDDRFDGKLSYNRFDDSRQMSVLAGGNNINELGFSWQDYFQFTGGMQQMMSGGGRGRGGFGGGRGFGGSNPLINQGTQPGFLTSFNGGLQFSQRYGGENEINASYFFSLADRTNERSLLRENFLPGNKTLSTSEEALNESKNYDHRLNIRWEQNLAERTALRLNSSVNYTTRDEFRSSQTQNFNPADDVTSISDQEFAGDGSNIDLNGSLTLRQRFEKRGRVLATTFSGSYRTNEQDGLLNALNQIYGPGSTIQESLLEGQDTENVNYSYGADIQYTEPVAENHFSTIQYVYGNNIMRNDREITDLSEEGNPMVIPALSSEYNADFLYHRVGLSHRIVKDKSNLNFGMDYQFSTLEGEVVGNDSPVSRNFSYLLPRASWNYEFHRGKNLNLNYSTSVREPSVIQLQPVVDNSDPLNLFVGNPDLEPQYTHRLNFRYTTFNMMTFRNFFVFGNVSYTRNRIREAISFDDALRRVRMPMNVSDDWTTTASVNYGQPIASTGLRANIRLGASYNWGNTFVGGVESETRTFSPNLDLRLTYELNEWLDVSGGTNILNTRTRYKIDEELDQSFQVYTHRMDIRTNFGENKWQIETGINWAMYRSDDGLFDDDVPIWNASISRFFMEDKRIQVKLIGRDLLDKNIGFNRTTDLNFIQEERTLSLGRYFLLEFRYNINAGANPASDRGGMFRMFSRMM